METRSPHQLDEVLPIEWLEHILDLTHHHEPHRLFNPAAQASSSWRIISYFSLLKKAHKDRDHAAQQFILVALFTHHPLLLKPSAQKALKNGLAWLKEYRCDHHILPESHLIAVALLMIIHPAAKEYKREFLSVSMQMKHNKPDFINALLTILAQHEKRPPLLNECTKISEKYKKYAPATYYIRSDSEKPFTVAEALLVLHSWPHNNQLLFPYIQQCFAGINSRDETYLNFLHAELIRLPKHHHFWQDSIAMTHFMYVLETPLSSNSSSAAFASIIRTLKKRAAEPSFLEKFLKYHQDYADSKWIGQIKQTLTIMQCQTETEKIKWLEKYSRKVIIYYSGRYQPISVILLQQLETEDSLKAAIYILYKLYKNPFFSKDKAYYINTLMLELLPKIKGEDFWRLWIKDLSIDLKNIKPFYTKENNNIDLMISSLFFLPTEQLTQTLLTEYFNNFNHESQNIDKKILTALCDRLTSVDLIGAWIKKLDKKLLNFLPVNSRYISIEKIAYLECYAILLAKVSDQIEMKNNVDRFLHTLQHLFTIKEADGHHLFKSAEKLLPHLQSEHAIKDWWDFLSITLHQDMFHQVRENKNRNPLINCLIVLLNIADKNHQSNYLKKLQEYFLKKVHHDTQFIPLISLAQNNDCIGNELIDTLFHQALESIKNKDECESLAYYINCFLHDINDREIELSQPTSDSHRPLIDDAVANVATKSFGA